MSVENKENSKAVEEISKDLEKTKVVDGAPPAVADQDDDEPNKGVALNLTEIVPRTI